MEKFILCVGIGISLGHFIAQSILIAKIDREAEMLRNTYEEASTYTSPYASSIPVGVNTIGREAAGELP